MGEHEDILNLELKINQLRVQYDQYFAALIRIPPFKLQEEVKKIVRLYSSRKISNTALNFKYNSLVGRYTTFDNLWKRHLRMLDDGTLKRGAGFSSGSALKKKEAPVNESPSEKLYKEYISAKQGLNQGTDNIKVQSLKAVIDKQTAAIKQKYKVDKVDFKVVTEGGQAKIKAIPRK